MVDNLILGLAAALQLKQFMFMVLGTVIGLWVGVLPGLGGPVAMAILIPFTFSMDPLSALLMLASISVGAAFGGSVTSMKVAMGLSAGASMAAAIAGVLILMFASGPVAKASTQAAAGSNRQPPRRRSRRLPDPTADASTWDDQFQERRAARGTRAQ